MLTYIYVGYVEKDIPPSVNVLVSVFPFPRFSSGVCVCAHNCFDLICMPVQGSSALVLKDLRPRVRLITGTRRASQRARSPGAGFRANAH